MHDTWYLDNLRARSLRIYQDGEKIGPYGIVEYAGTAFLRVRNNDNFAYIPLEPNSGARAGSFTLGKYADPKLLNILIVRGDSVSHEQAAGRRSEEVLG